MLRVCVSTCVFSAQQEQSAPPGSGSCCSATSSLQLCTDGALLQGRCSQLLKSPDEAKQVQMKLGRALPSSGMQDRDALLSSTGFAQCLRRSSSCCPRVLGQGEAGGEKPAAPSAILAREQTVTCLQPPVCSELQEHFLCL